MSTTVPEIIAEQSVILALSWFNGQCYRMEDCASDSHELTVWIKGDSYNVVIKGAMPMVIVELVKAVRELIEASNASDQ